MEVTIKLLENAMKEAIDRKSGSHGWEDGRGRFLIDGFPRKMDQALKFDEELAIGSGFPLEKVRKDRKAALKIYIEKYVYHNPEVPKVTHHTLPRYQPP